jgi:hypothetical protein
MDPRRLPGFVSGLYQTAATPALVARWDSNGFNNLRVFNKGRGIDPHRPYQSIFFSIC